MAKQVIKNDGSKVPFDAKKISRSITRAAQDAKLPPEEINRLVNDITNNVMIFAETKDKIKSSEIRDFILSDLDRVGPIVAIEWRKFMNA
jgi:transcriptional regulator NrdR family protein